MKLSKRIRDKIVDDVLKDKGCLSKIHAAEDAAKEAAILEWEKNYPHDKASKAAIEEWADTTSAVYVNNREGYHVTSFHHCREMYKRAGRTPSVVITDEIKAAMDAVEAAEKERDEIESLVRSVVNSCDTNKQLIETAPELARFLPDGSATVTAMVDMATVNRLRAMLGS